MFTKVKTSIKIAIIFLIIFTPSFSYANLSPNQSQQIQTLLYNWHERLHIPAISLGISLPDNPSILSFTTGTTTIDGEQKIDHSTIFQAGSISKSFTSMIILQLMAQNKIHLDDAITTYLPQYPRWEKITVRELLNHTSGIFDYTKTGRFQHIRETSPEAEMTPEMLVNMASTHTPYFPPGKGWKYSNTNYVLAGMIIEAVTKQPFGNTLNFYLHNNNILSLTNTFYLPRIYTQNEIAKMAHGYNGSQKDVTQSNMSWAFSAGAVVSTPSDLIAWWQSIFHNKILSPEQLAQMTSLVCEHTSKKNNCISGSPTTHLEVSQVDRRYGLGIIQSSSGSSKVGTVWWHNGSTQGYKAIVMWYPKNDIYMSLMIDRDPGFLLTPNLPVIRNLLQVLLDGSYSHIPSKRKPNNTNYTVVAHHHRMIQRKKMKLRSQIRGSIHARAEKKTFT